MTTVYLSEYPLGYPFTLTELMTYGVYFPEENQNERKKGVIKDTYVGTVEVVENPNFKEGTFEENEDNLKVNLDDNFEHTSKWNSSGGLKVPSYRLQEGKAVPTQQGNANIKLTNYDLYREYYKDGKFQVDENENFVVPAKNKFVNKNGKIEVNVNVDSDEIKPEEKVDVKSGKKDEDENEKKVINIMHKIFDVNDLKKTLGEDDYKPNKKDDTTGYSEQIEYNVEIPEDLSSIKNSKYYANQRQEKAKKTINIIVPDVDLDKAKRKYEYELELQKKKSVEVENIPLRGNYNVRPLLDDIITDKVKNNIPKPSYTLIKDESNYETAGDYKAK
jgi:hypothetical protein